MPPLPSPGHVIELALQQLLGTDTDCLNKLYFSYAGGPIVTADMATWLEAVVAAWTGHMPAVLCDDISLTETTGTDLSSDVGVRNTVISAVPGTAAGPSVPAGTAFVIKYGIARRYRGGKPRSYLAGLPNSLVFTDQTWEVVGAVAVTAAWVGFIDAIVAAAPAGFGTLAQVNVSWFEGFTSVENPVTHRYRNIPTLRVDPVVDPITGYAYNPNIASQRRRNQQRTVR